MTFQNENVDLTNLLSIRDLARKLLDSDLPKLDAIVCNAGIGGWSDLDWVQAVRDILSDIPNSTTWPEYKLGTAGSLTKPQLPSSNTDSTDPEPPLAEIFCANLFGHYMLIHWLVPLFRACNATSPAKIIWISSIEPQDYHFSENDFQGLQTTSPYEHGKRLTDILVLTCNQPETANSVSAFLSTSSALSRRERPDNVVPSMHVFQPGILVTPIFPLPPVLFELYLATIYVARLLGGVWSNVQPYTAAHGVTYLLLTPDSEISAAERAAHSSTDTSSSAVVAPQGKVKWGTSINRMGKTTVRPTEVAWWGINGSGAPYVEGWWGGKGGRGRKLRAKEATGDDVRGFVGIGGRVWRGMEELREMWEGRIERAGV